MAQGYVFRPPPQPQRALPSAILPAAAFPDPPYRNPTVAMLAVITEAWQPAWGPIPQRTRFLTVPIASVVQIDDPPPYRPLPAAIYNAWLPPMAVSLAGLAVPVDPQGDQPPLYVPLPYQILRAWQAPWGPWPGVNRYVTAPIDTPSDAPPFGGSNTGAADVALMAQIREMWPENGYPLLSQPQVGRRNIATFPLVFGDAPPVKGAAYYAWNVFVAWQPVWGPRPNQHFWLGAQTPPSQVGVVGDPPRNDANLASLMWGGFR